MPKKEKAAEATESRFTNFEYPLGKGPALIVPMLGKDVLPGEVFAVSEDLVGQIAMFAGFQRTDRPVSRPELVENKEAELASEGGPETEEER